MDGVEFAANKTSVLNTLMPLNPHVIFVFPPKQLNVLFPCFVYMCTVNCILFPVYAALMKIHTFN